jgi:hypothetical protein
MTDLTLHDYKGFSEEELRRILQAEALKIYGAEGLGKKNVLFSHSDSGGRRSGTDRRQFSYDIHIPERRHGEDRRSGLDRRSGFDRRKRRELLGATRLKH